MSNPVSQWFDNTESEVLHRRKDQADFTIAELKIEATKRDYIVLETKSHYIVVRDGSSVIKSISARVLKRYLASR